MRSQKIRKPLSLRNPQKFLGKKIRDFFSSLLCSARDAGSVGTMSVSLVILVVLVSGLLLGTVRLGVEVVEVDLLMVIRNHRFSPGNKIYFNNENTFSRIYSNPVDRNRFS